jgi:hypothetical protein
MLAREVRQAAAHAAMATLVERTKAREETRARRDHEINQRYAHEPMTGMQWSPRSGRSVS